MEDIKNKLNTLILNPDKEVYTLNQLQDIFKCVEDIVGNLDDLAIKELFSGSEKDVSHMFDIIFAEVADALYSPKKIIKTSSFGYLDKLTANFDRELRRQSLNYFITAVLPDFEMNWHHIEWGNLVQLYLLLCIIAARGHGKSHYFSLAYALWNLYRYNPDGSGSIMKKKNNLLKKGMIITNEQTLSNDFLRFIKEEIETNPILREYLYPRGFGRWEQEGIICNNKAELQVRGAGSALRGRHPGWIDVDDLLDESTLYSKVQREKQIDHFNSVVMNMIEPGGQVIVVGTPFHEEDLYAILKRNSLWKVFEYPGLYPDGSVLWQNRFNLQALLAKRESGSLAFSREILCKPITSESSLFPWEILKLAFREMDKYTLCKNINSFPIKFKKVVVGCDFAISANVGADDTVFITLGVDTLDHFWLLNVWRKKGASYNEQIANLKRIRREFRPNVIMAEDNAFQKIMIDLCNENGLNIIGHTTGAEKYDFKSGIPGMAVLFEQGRMKFPRGDVESRDTTDELCSQLNSMSYTDKGIQGVGSHDDMPMALWIALIACHYVSKSFKFTFI